MKITFHRADVSATIKNTTFLKQFIGQTFKEATGRDITLRIIFCSDDYLLDINRTHLHHDYYTDIITFPLGKTAVSEEAEIYISVDRVKENAKLEGNTYTSELLRVIFHGVLHLTGLKDKTPQEQQIMRKQEDQWLQAYNTQIAT